MNKLLTIWVWIRRISHSLGFGIQSPTDYAFVRYVINEHWPYYAYEKLDQLSKDPVTRKLGRLYFRLANWRQPKFMDDDRYRPYWRAGCQKTLFTPNRTNVELALLQIEDYGRYEYLLQRTDEHSVLVVEGLSRDWSKWKAIESDPRVGTTFDLYYCGIILFNQNNYKHHYIINF